MAASDSIARPLPAGAHGSIGLAGATAVVAGSMIGSGIFLLPAGLGAIGSISILGWGAATAAALAVAGMFSWLGIVAPGAKGLPGYVDAGLGRFFGVQTTVIYWSLCWVGNVAIALAVAGYASFLIPALAPAGPRLATTLAVLWLAVGASWIGPRTVARIEGLTLLAGLAPILLVATLGWFWFDPAGFMRSWNPAGAEPIAAIRSSALTAFWAFLGLECAAAVSGVVRNPSRNVPRATLGGVLLAAIVYIAACSVLMGLVPAAQLARSSAPFADATRATIGFGGAALIAVCGLMRAAGCVTGWMLVAAETTREGADQQVFPAPFRSRPDGGMSGINLVTMGVLTSLVAMTTASPTLGGQFALLANVSVILSLMAYVMAGVSLLRLLSRLDSRGRRVGAAVTALAAIGCSLALIAAAKPLELVLSLVAPVAATGLYLAMRRR